MIQGFNELVQSRREWIARHLEPWCRQASRRDLLLAEADWTNLAGKAPAEKTLWYWAWSRFSGLCNPELMSINETDLITVSLRGGATVSGFPDARQSTHGQLVLLALGGETLGPFSIDEIQQVTPNSA